jgi:hypothetical protein
MKPDQGVVGIYSYLDTTIETIKSLQTAGFKNVRVFSPFPCHELEEVLEQPESIVRFFTLGGGLLGAICGFSFTILTSTAWPLSVSAKPIVSFTPYMVIVFELTVLIGALSTLLGLLINSRLRHNTPKSVYDSRFSEDKFGVVVTCYNHNIPKVQEIMKSSGAEEIRFEGI